MTKTKRKKMMQALGYKDASADEILKIQKKYFRRKKDRDGLAGPATDKMIECVYNVLKYTKNFTPDEFRCKCGNCTGYPAVMQPGILKIAQKIRTSEGPMTITCGLRCAAYNEAVGGIPNSEHCRGRAFDGFIVGKSSPTSLIYLCKLARKFGAAYAYCKHWASKRNLPNSAKGMGNAFHVDK